MNYLSINIKGAADGRKEKWIREVKKENGINFLCFQETSLVDSLEIRFDQYWGNGSFDVEWVNANGRSGGLCSIWDPKFFIKQKVLKDKNFLLIHGLLVEDSSLLTIVNVYGPQNPIEKRELWDRLLNVKGKFEGKWLLIGDFNEVRFPDDRFNSRFNHIGATYFNEFIYNAGFMEYAMSRRKFTFRAGNSQKLSKIDRALVCEGFWNKWPKASFFALNTSLSDHCPIILLTDTRNFGPIPFRFFDSWLNHPELPNVVDRCCDNIIPSDIPSKTVASKLRGLKNAIKIWIASVKKKQNERLLEAKEQVVRYEELLEERILSEQELEHEIECRLELSKIEAEKVMDLRQRARIKWAVEGDENSAFFHGFINNRICKSRLNWLRIGGEWCNEPIKIKQEAQDFFAKRFGEPLHVRPSFNCEGIARLEEVDRGMLDARFTSDEVLKAVKECDGNRAPGPDGFNFNFIKRFWCKLEKDFMELMHRFHEDGFIHKGVSSSFITLIPKITDPSCLNDYRPISLLGCVSKIISKVLANRLRRVIGKLISDVQTGFLAGRNILEGPLIINELIGWAKRAKHKTLFFKIDFEKAFDSINWAFVDKVLKFMNFSDKWRRWTHGILASARASVLINGSPSKEFQYERGVRQGDPLSPFIFIIAMEAFTFFMNKGCELELFKGFKTPNSGPCLSHLSYADDVMLIGDWRLENMDFIVRFLRAFNLISGLKINFHKSSIFGVGCDSSEVSEMAERLGCNIGKIPFLHLGLMIGANMNQFNNWKPVIDLVESRLSLWKTKTLSIGGRVTLLKSVFESLPVYYFSLYKAPMRLIQKLDGLRRRFLWGCNENNKGISWVSWEVVTMPKDRGGLGLTPLREFNISLLSKWYWKFRNEQDRLWRRTISALHDSKLRSTVVPCKTLAAGNWKSICSIEAFFSSKGIDINLQFRGKIGKGDSLMFWLDNWSGLGQLSTRFPTLFKLEACKKVNVASRIQEDGSFVWKWKNESWSNTAINELIALHNLDMHAHFSDEQDYWEWGVKDSKLFSVQSVRSILETRDKEVRGALYPWNRLIPAKVNVFGWRLWLNKLPSKVALSRRGLQIDSMVCVFCNEQEETLDHLLTGCIGTNGLWNAIEDWCRLPPLIVFSAKDLILLSNHIKGSSVRKILIQSVIMVACWVIWKSRNNMVFNGSKVNIERMLKEIKTLGFLWIKNRASKWSLDEVQWTSFSFD